MTYAVRWRENDGPQFAGGLRLDSDGVELTGTANDSPAAHLCVSYADMCELYLDRAAQPSLVLVTRAGDHVEIGSLQGLGALHELVDHVASARVRHGV